MDTQESHLLNWFGVIVGRHGGQGLSGPAGEVRHPQASVVQQLLEVSERVFVSHSACHQCEGYSQIHQLLELSLIHI